MVRNELDLFVMFGGYTIYVPQDWNVIVDLVPIFGGFSDKRIKDPNRVYEENKILIIKGLVLIWRWRNKVLSFYLIF